MLDSVRAAERTYPALARNVIIVGQSQGAGAAFAAAAFAPRNAPNLDIRGTVATGTPYLGPSAPRVQRAAEDTNRVRPQVAYLAYGVIVAQQKDPTLKDTDVFTDRGLPLLREARSMCIFQLENDAVFAGLTASNILKPDWGRIMATVEERLALPTLKLTQPLFMGIGATDDESYPESQIRATGCGKG